MTTPEMIVDLDLDINLNMELVHKSLDLLFDNKCDNSLTITVLYPLNNTWKFD